MIEGEWLCAKCSFRIPLRIITFPMRCQCGLFQVSLDSKPVMPTGLTARDVIDNPCKHQLPTIEHRECKGCRGTVKIKVNGCEKHGECTVVFKFAGVMACTRCDDYLVTAESTNV